jgi:hypothetical protein
VSGKATLAITPIRDVRTTWQAKDMAQKDARPAGACKVPEKLDEW